MMANYMWFIVVAGGAALLGLALAYGSYKESRHRSLIPLAGLAVAVAIGFAVSSGVTQAPTAESVPPDPQGTHYDTPAAPSRENALPGTPTPSDQN
jgi:hypothetical protein